MSSILRWDIFCKVVDNFGDIGVCWRLCCDLAVRGHTVRLWLDDVSALAWMAPTGCPGVTVIDCSQGVSQTAVLTPGDVLVDTFGCEFAINLIANNPVNTPSIGKNNAQNRPVWLNLEYLTAESFAQRNHTLPCTHHAGPAAGWTQRYFYPGFNVLTGGLLREKDLAQRQTAFDRVVWLNQLSLDLNLGFTTHAKDNSQFISLFCYEPAALEQLLDQLAHPAQARQHTYLLVTHGRAAQAVKAILEHKNKHEPAWNMPELLSILFIPALTQRDYDHLLWACDLNFVRGEDSLVRAIWAGKPFVWQIYPQHDDVHHHKLNAFLEMMQAPDSLKMAHKAWNADKSESENVPKADDEAPSWPELDLPLWAQSAQNLSKKLRQQDDLATNLIAFVEKNG
ncbi:MAG: elongation factor P maturation arginine rhamnosyltransferase EarP [Burkholderiaceae bacterium]|nr:elongation factor P maturation arginine rhamnosyltransferase EarP [Burkholderiaceae bacterium]